MRLLLCGSGFLSCSLLGGGLLLGNGLLHSSLLCGFLLGSLLRGNVLVLRVLAHAVLDRIDHGADGIDGGEGDVGVEENFALLLRDEVDDDHHDPAQCAERKNERGPLGIRFDFHVSSFMSRRFTLRQFRSGITFLFCFV